MSDATSRGEALIRAWEKTVDVQQHFNDLSLRVRNFAVTVATAALGGAALSLREAPSAAPWVLGAGALAWIAFYLMDAFWYHRLLLGSVVHGEKLEKELEEAGYSGFGLTAAIREKSPVRVGFLGWKLHSTGRLHGFYLAGVALFCLLWIGAWTTEERASTRGSEVLASTGLNAKTEPLFPPEGAVLKAEEGVSLGWTLSDGAAHYRLEVQNKGGEEMLSVVLPQMQGSFVIGRGMVEPGLLLWRAVPIDVRGKPMQDVAWTSFELIERGGGE